MGTLGRVRLRQLRVKDDACTVSSYFSGRVGGCYAPYRSATEETESWALADDIEDLEWRDYSDGGARASPNTKTWCVPARAERTQFVEIRSLNSSIVRAAWSVAWSVSPGRLPVRVGQMGGGCFDLFVRRFGLANRGRVCVGLLRSERTGRRDASPAPLASSRSLSR